MSESGHNLATRGSPSDSRIKLGLRKLGGRGMEEVTLRGARTEVDRWRRSFVYVCALCFSLPLCHRCEVVSVSVFLSLQARP